LQKSNGASGSRADVATAGQAQTRHACTASQLSSEAARLPIDRIASYLMEHLGRPMTAYIGGVSDPKMVSHWVGGNNTPRAVPQMRLREAYQAARLIIETLGVETAKAWFFCSNADLADEAPAHMLRKAAAWEDMRIVVPAARAFVHGAGDQSAGVA